MKVAYSTSCFSNDSDYYSCVCWVESSWKSVDYWTEVGWSADVWVRLTASDNWFVFSVDSVFCTVCLYISDRICSLLHTCSVCFVIIKNCFVVAASYPCFVGIRNTVTHFSELRGNITHFQNELKETLIFIHYHHHDRSFVFHFDLHYKLTDTV